MTREQFGTQTALYHKLRYNVRGQLFEVRLSTVNDADDANRGCLMMFIGSWDWGASGTSNNGNIWGVRHWSPVDEAGSSFTWVQENYEYDQMNRVTRAYGYQSALGHQYTQAFDYDRWGNRQINQSLTWGTGINNRQFTIDQSTNRLGVPSGQSGTISYDASGNQTQDSYSGWGSRTFDGENRLLTQLNTSSQEIARYTYDAGGRRVRKMMSGVETWYLHGLDGELVAEYTAGQPQTNPLKEYGYRNGELLVTAGQSADVRWLVTDHLGTPRMTADNTGSLAGIRRHDYLPFGEELQAGVGGRTTGQGYQPDNIRQQFTGYERDGETGLDYAQARYYASLQGRFTSVDPLLGIARAGQPQNWNKYAYCLNNPLIHTDPTGMIWVKNSSGTQIVWFSQERWDNEIRDARNEDGNPLYTPLTESEMEYNSSYGRIRLNPNGPDQNAEPGTDAYQGWSVIGDNTTDYSAAFAGGLLLGQRGRNPWFMLGGATIGTLWILSNNPIGPIPAIDPNIYGRKRDLELIDHMADRYGIDRETLALEVEDRKRTVGRGGRSIGRELVEEIARELAGLGPATTDVEDHVSDEPEP